MTRPRLDYLDLSARLGLSICGRAPSARRSFIFIMTSGFWWAKRHEFPKLWQLARVILATPAAAVPNESASSAMAAIDAPGRQSMLIEWLYKRTLTSLRAKTDNVVAESNPAWPAAGVPVADRRLRQWLQQVDDLGAEREEAPMMQAAVNGGAAEDICLNENA